MKNNGWLPIKYAPRDETEVILYIPAYKTYPATQIASHWHKPNLGKGYWWNAYSENPTHYKPLGPGPYDPEPADQRDEALRLAADALEEIRDAVAFPDEQFWISEKSGSVVGSNTYPSDDPTEYREAKLEAALAAIRAALGPVPEKEE